MAGDDGMRCPVCGSMNLMGADICDNCGADLFGVDVPQQAPAFKGRLLGEHLDDLGAPPPITVASDTPDPSVVGQPVTIAFGVTVDGMATFVNAVFSARKFTWPLVATNAWVYSVP